MNKQLQKVFLDFYNIFFKHYNPNDGKMKELLTFDPFIELEAYLGEGKFGEVDEWKPNEHSYMVEIISVNGDQIQALVKELTAQIKLYKLKFHDRVNTLRFLHVNNKKQNLISFIHDKLEKLTFENMKNITYRQFEEYCHYLIKTQELLIENGLYHGDIYSGNIMKKGDVVVFTNCCNDIKEKTIIPSAVKRVHMAMLAYVLGSHMWVQKEADYEVFAYWPNGWNEVRRIPRKHFLTLKYTDMNGKNYFNKFKMIEEDKQELIENVNSILKNGRLVEGYWVP